jgi:hypothetical protein
MALVVYAYGRPERKEDTEPLDPMCEFFTKKEIGRDGSTQHNHRFPHDACPHHTLRFQAFYQKNEYSEPRQHTESEVMMLFVFSVPLEMGVSEKLGKCHDKDIEYSHV